MYIDLGIVIIILILGIFFVRRFSHFVYLVALIDVFLRLLNFLKNHLKVPELSSLIRKYFPSSLPNLLSKYFNGIFLEILLWGLFIIYCAFFFYITRTFFKKQRR